MIAVDDLTVVRGRRRVVDGVTLAIRGGEVLALVGPNGAGKSSLLAAVAGDLPAAAGRVTVDGRSLRDWRPLELARRRAVMVQAARLGFSLPVHDVVALGRAPFEASHSRAANAAAVTNALAVADIPHLAGRGYLGLSGGEQQRVQFARAVAQLDLPPDSAYLHGTPLGSTAPAAALLLDEPTASLDLAHAHGVLLAARRLAARGVAVAVVLHDLGLALRYADRMAVLQDGLLVALGAPAAVLTPELMRRVFGVAASLAGGALLVSGPAGAAA